MYQQLLEQAGNLAHLDAKKPKQGNLRRAVSSAYYALFHFLVDQACRAAIGARHDQANLRQVLGRAFDHGAMKNACVSYSGGSLKAKVAKGLPPGFSVPPEVRRMATTFAELQGMRNLADYDLTERFRRSDVLSLIRQTEDAIQQFQNLGSSDEKKFFLACLWAWKELVKR